MIEPIFPLLGVPPNIQLLDPLTVFTPLTASLVALCSLVGIAVGVLITRAGTRRTSDTTRSATTPILPKAA
jgi:hypothetical protein